MKRLLVLVSMTYLAAPALAVAQPVGDKCIEVAKKALGNSTGNAWYWDGTTLHHLRGKNPVPDEIIFYFPRSKKPSAGNLGLPEGTPVDETMQAEDKKCPGGALLTSTYRREEQALPPPEATPSCIDVKNATEIDYIRAYRSAGCRVQQAQSASIAADAVQILGQIVVDRASEAAYALVSTKARRWLKCGASTRFAATCQVLEALRLQDLAMAPDQLRASLAKDAFGFIDMLAQKTLKKVTPQKSSALVPSRAVFAPQTDTTTNGTPAGADNCKTPLAGSPTDVKCTVKSAIETHVVPLLARPVSTLTGHPADAMIREVVNKGLDKVEQSATKKLCQLHDRDRILALVGVAFVACKVTGGECEIAQVVAKFEDTCQTPLRQQVEKTDAEITVLEKKEKKDSHDDAELVKLRNDSTTAAKALAEQLTPHQLAYAQSIASHLWQGVTLKKGTASDDAKRLVAAVEGAFEIACMYSIENEDGPYQCAIQSDKHDETPLEPYESVAIARDVTIAAATRDGAALATTFIAAMSRILPAADNKEVSKGLRVLATITAYAATYTGTDATSEDAHERRTSLLESLTRDMTNRTHRGGDVITSFGGSLRGFLGRRLGHERTDMTSGQETQDEAFAPPLSLTLGFAMNKLYAGDDTRGVHLELGILDLGQYLSWDEGGKVGTPELTSALSPSITLAGTWGRELPFFVGITFGYTPSFDFDASNDTDRKGAYNFGVAAGVYVPLFDFN